MKRRRNPEASSLALVGLALAAIAAVAYHFYKRSELVTAATADGKVITVARKDAPDANVPISFEV